MPCEWAGKLQGGGRNLAFQGLTFVPPYGASHLLGHPMNISKACKVLSLILAIQCPTYEKALK